MTKGELKKLIESRNHWDKELNLKTNLRLFDVDWKRMALLLDDARTEFPEVFHPPAYDRRTGRVIEISKLWCNPEKAAEWFLKYFGENQK